MPQTNTTDCPRSAINSAHECYNIRHLSFFTRGRVRYKVEHNVVLTVVINSLSNLIPGIFAIVRNVTTKTLQSLWFYLPRIIDQLSPIVSLDWRKKTETAWTDSIILISMKQEYKQKSLETMAIIQSIVEGIEHYRFQNELEPESVNCLWLWYGLYQRQLLSTPKSQWQSFHRKKKGIEKQDHEHNSRRQSEIRWSRRVYIFLAVWTI